MRRLLHPAQRQARRASNLARKAQPTQAQPALPEMCCAQQAKMPRRHGSVVALRVWALLLVHWCAALWQRLGLLLTMPWIRLSMALLDKVLGDLPVGFLVALVCLSKLHNP